MPVSRRRFLLRTARCGAIWFAPPALISALGFAPAQEPAADEKNGNTVADPEKSAAALFTAAAGESAAKGLAFLADHQHDDGSFGSGGYSRNVAVCALAGMAFLSAGSTPGRGPYGKNVSRAVDFILDHIEDSGFISVAGSATHGPMYGHGFATMFLAETYGMTQRSDIREKLGKAVKLIIETQNPEGGWRYQPQRVDHADISVTICQVMALRAARNAGLQVPRETIDRCVDYVKRSQNADGGFMYMIQGGPSDFPRSAAGVVALYTPAFTKDRKSTRAWSISANSCRRATISTGRTITSTATTTPCKRCGRPAASVGCTGIRQFAMRSSSASATTARGSIPFASNTAPPWPASSCRCRTTICRSFNDSHAPSTCHKTIRASDSTRAFGGAGVHNNLLRLADCLGRLA